MTTPTPIDELIAQKAEAYVDSQDCRVVDQHGDLGGYSGHQMVDAFMAGADEAAEALTLLRDAVEPFARAADKMRDNVPNAVNVFAQSPLFVPGSTDSVGTVSDFRRARAALTATKIEKDQAR